MLGLVAAVGLVACGDDDLPPAPAPATLGPTPTVAEQGEGPAGRDIDAGQSSCLFEELGIDPVDAFASDVTVDPDALAAAADTCGIDLSELMVPVTPEP